MLVVDVSVRYSSTDVTNHPWLCADFKCKHTQRQNHLTMDQLNNLRNFHAKNRVQKIVLRLRAQKLADESVEDLRAVFRKLDKNGTGEVPVCEIRDKIRRIPSLNENLEEIMKVLWSLNHSSGCVNFDRFLDAMVKRHADVQKEACRAIFDVFDFDGSGSISRDELKLAIGIGTETDSFRAGIETVFGMSADQIETRFALGGSLESAEYTFDEFFEIMKKGVG